MNNIPMIQQVAPQDSMNGAMLMVLQQLMNQQAQSQIQADKDCVNCGGNEAMPSRNDLDALQDRFLPLTSEQSISMRLVSGQVGRLYGPVTRRAYDVGEDGLIVVDVLDARRYQGQQMAGGALMFERIDEDGSSSI